MPQLLTTFAESGLPGQVATTQPWYAEPCTYSATQLNHTYTLNLNPMIGSVVDFGNYSLSISGSLSTLVFRQGSGSTLLDFTSQWANHINRFGFYWASISSSGVLTLTARQAGISYPILLGSGMTGATLTQTQAPFTPTNLIAGTLVFWNQPYTANPRDHRQVTTHNIASAQSGFNFVRDLAGITMRDSTNYQASDTIVSEVVEVLRVGSIWVRNYGTNPLSRASSVAFNPLAGTPTLPSGAFGLGTVITPAMGGDRLQYDSFANPQESIRLRILLP